MSNTGWIMIGLVFVVLAAVIGIYLYQKSKNDALAINAQKLAALQGGLNSATAQGYQASGLGGFISGIFGTALNSDTTKALAPSLLKLAL